MPTLCEIAGTRVARRHRWSQHRPHAPRPTWTKTARIPVLGIPQWRPRPGRPVWELEGDSQQVTKSPDATPELYDLATDPGEKINLAGQHPDLAAKAAAYMKAAHSPSREPKWNFLADQR